MQRIAAITISAILGISFVLSATPPAAVAMSAQPPKPTPAPVSDSVDFPAGFPCRDFAIRIESSGKIRPMELLGGRLIVEANPGLTATLTNLDQPENQETFNIAGVFHTTRQEAGNITTVATGRNLLFDPEAGFVLAIGTFSYVFDAEGNLLQPLAGEGQLIDVCALLA